MRSVKNKILILLLIILSSCGVQRKVVVENRIEYTYLDSLRIRDSVVVIPKERIVDIVPVYDTLVLETSKAEAKAYVDTSLHVLKGQIQNKTGIEYKYVEKEKTVYRDSLVIKEIPVEVEKVIKTHYPYEKFLWMYVIITLGLFGLWLWRKSR